MTTPEMASNLPKKKSKKKIIIIAIVAVILVFLGYKFITKNKNQPQETKTAIPQKVTVVQVGSEATQYALLDKTLQITSQKEVKVLAEYSGRLQEVKFEVGDRVAAGQTLAIFSQAEDENTAVIDLNAASSSLDYAKDNVDNVEDSTEKDIKIAKNNVEISKINLEKAQNGEGSLDVSSAEEYLEQAKRQRDKTEISAESQVESAKNTLELAQSAYDRAVLYHNKTIITAPVAGIITQKDVSDRTYLNSGDNVANISSANELISRIYLSENEVTNLKTGDTVDVVCQAGKEQAAISNISSLPNNSNMRYGVTLEFPSSGSASQCIKPNSFAKAQFKIPAKANSNHFFIPLAAVQLGQEKNIVFVAGADNAAQSREVKVGQVFGSFIEVTSGLSNGDRLVVEGSRNLRDGDSLEIGN